MAVRDVSPCIGICRLDAEDRCVGCLRYMHEIRVWGLLTVDERRKILADIVRRRSPAIIAQSKDPFS